MEIAFLSFGRPLWVLLGGILFTHLGYYLILPLLSIVLTTEKGLTVAQVGMVLGAGSISFLAGSLLGGWLNDRLGPRRTLVLGLLLRAAGMLVYGFVSTLPWLFTASVTTGIGGGIYTPPAKAGIATFASETNRSTAFSFRGIAANIGVTLGPVIGTFLATGSSFDLFLTASLIHAGLALVHRLLLPDDCTDPLCNVSERGSAWEILNDRAFLVFSLVTVLVWALYTQLTFSIPLRAADILPNPKIVGILWTVTSLMIIFLQAPITRYLTAAWHPLVILAWGVLLMGIGLGTVMWASRFFHLVLSVAVFTLGEMLVMPTVDANVSQLAKPRLIGTYFGIAALVWGLGEALGNIGGGQIYSLSRRLGTPALPWVVFAMAGGLLGLVFYILREWPPLARPLTGSLEKRAATTLSPTRARKERTKIR